VSATDSHSLLLAGASHSCQRHHVPKSQQHRQRQQEIQFSVARSRWRSQLLWLLVSQHSVWFRWKQNASGTEWCLGRIQSRPGLCLALWKALNPRSNAPGPPLSRQPDIGHNVDTANVVPRRLFTTKLISIITPLSRYCHAEDVVHPRPAGSLVRPRHNVEPAKHATTKTMLRVLLV
jgi:hypothetical protein